MTQYQRHIGRFLIKIQKIRTKYVSHRNFLIFISFIVGLVSALAAVLLKISVQFVEHKSAQLNDWMHSNWLTAIFPLLGVGLSLLIILKLFKGNFDRGVGFIVTGIFTQKSKIDSKHTFGHILTSAVTVALGGSSGLEAPIVATGAAIGSNTGKDLRLSYRDVTLLLACGTASGIAAIFNSPIAGIIFALEVLMIDFNIPFFIPLLISTATATVVSQVLYPDKFFFLVIHGWDINALPYYILLGALCGFTSVYVSYMVERIEGYFALRKADWRTWLLGGIPLCILIFAMPALYGEGYSTITALLQGRYDAVTSHSFLQFLDNKALALALMCFLLIIFKVITASLTIGAGGDGGIFAPSLMIGGLLGFLYAYGISLSGLHTINIPNFIIAAMAGVLAGVMHAPLTAIFLLAEVTGGYTLFVPLMIVTAVSYFITRKYFKHSLYHKTLVEKRIIRVDPYQEQDHF